MAIHKPDNTVAFTYKYPDEKIIPGREVIRHIFLQSGVTLAIPARDTTPIAKKAAIKFPAKS